MLTAERKKRGKKAPEGLASAETIASYRQLASHPVGLVGVRAEGCHIVFESVVVDYAGVAQRKHSRHPCTGHLP